MAGSPSVQNDDEGAIGTVFDRLRRSDRVVLGVVVVTVFALLARLIVLGVRPVHWDEARVAYWALYARQTGNFAYRSIVHGPFIQHADRWLFAFLAPNEFVMRLPVALIGGLFPMSALLFRGHLRDEETVALSLLLAFNPVLLYYSRFMRSDVLVAAFMFTTLGMLVRLSDTRRMRYLYGASLFLALGVASKENAILYVLTWLGAGALLVDRTLDRPGSDRTGVSRFLQWVSVARERARQATRPQARRRSSRHVLHALGALVLFGLVWLFMFAPRGAGLEGLYTNHSGSGSVGLWAALPHPGKWPALLDATYSQFADQYLAWGGKAGDLTFQQYQDRLGDSIVQGLLGTSGVLILFSVAGFARERYTQAEGRNLVFLLFFAGVASVIGYPLGLSIPGGWKWGNVHVLVALALPAAVGLGAVYRWGVDAFVQDEPLDVGLTGLIIAMIVLSVAWSGLTHVYLNPQHKSNALVQFGQPSDDLRPVVEELQAAAPSAGTDVLIYGNTSEDNSIVSSGVDPWNVRPICTDLTTFLPMHWYLERTDVQSDCARTPAELKDRADPQEIPVVITRKQDETVPHEWLGQHYTHLGNYSLRYVADADPTIVVYVRDDLAG